MSDSSFHVIRFPAANPSQALKLDVRSNNSGLNIESQGHVWVTNRFGPGLVGMAHMVDMAVHLKTGGVLSASDYLTKTMSEQKGGSGSVTVLRPDGTQLPGSPFKGGGLPGPWAVVVDGNDNLWISNFASPASPIVQLCGVRTEKCAPQASRLAIRSRRRGRPCRRRSAAADRHRHRCGRRPLGHEQLAGHRQLLCRGNRGTVHALWRPRRRRLLRHGQTGARAADRAGATVLDGRRFHSPDSRPVQEGTNMPVVTRPPRVAISMALLLAAVACRAEMSAEELAKLAQNPVGNLISLPFQNNTNFNVGPL